MADIIIEDGPDGIRHHLPNGGIQDASTLCGIFADNDGAYTPATGKLTCQVCIDMAREVYDAISKRELKAL